MEDPRDLLSSNSLRNLHSTKLLSSTRLSTWAELSKFKNLKESQEDKAEAVSDKTEVSVVNKEEDSTIETITVDLRVTEISDNRARQTSKPTPFSSEDFPTTQLTSRSLNFSVRLENAELE